MGFGKKIDEFHNVMKDTLDFIGVNHYHRMFVGLDFCSNVWPPVSIGFDETSQKNDMGYAHTLQHFSHTIHFTYPTDPLTHSSTYIYPSLSIFHSYTENLNLDTKLIMRRT